MIDDGNVYKLADDRFWMMINTAAIEDWFSETADDLDAEVAHRTEDLAMIAVQGPTSQATLQGLTERDLGDLRYFRFWPEPTTVAGVPGADPADRLLGGEGVRGRLAPEDARRVWDALIAAGGSPFGLTADRPRPHGGRPDHHRGRLRPGRALPVGPLDGPVHQDRTRSAWARRRSRPTARTRRSVSSRSAIEGDAVPEYGAAVTKDGAEVGTVTSPAASPAPGHDRPRHPRCRTSRTTARRWRSRSAMRPRPRPWTWRAAVRPEKKKPRA